MNEQTVPFISLASYANNFGSFIKNFTTSILYGVTSNGNSFNLMPCTYSGIPGGIYVETHVIQDPSGRIDTLANKTYRPPMQNAPLYVEEHNCLLFASAEERAKQLDLYGSGSKLVKAYAVGMVSMINANFKAVTCLNVDKEYFTIGSNGITKIPSISEDYVQECLRKYKIDPEELTSTDIFIVSTVVKDVKIEGQRHSNMSTDVRKVKRSDRIKGQPLIFENDGLILFDGRSDAEAFVKKFGTVANYMVHKALEATHEIHDEELEDVNAQASKDKRGLVETFGLMGATSVASILTENLIKSYNDDDDTGETTKKALKIFAVGAIGIGSVFGLYKLYRYVQTKNEKAKKEAERLERYGS